MQKANELIILDGVFFSPITKYALSLLNDNRYVDFRLALNLFSIYFMIYCMNIIAIWKSPRNFSYINQQEASKIDKRLASSHYQSAWFQQ